MNRDDAKVFLHAGIFALCLVLAAAAYAAVDPPKLPAGVTCADVRAKVAEYGKVYAYAWARLQGFTAAEINEARKCLR
jgi:hypothetical protein